MDKIKELEKWRLVLMEMRKQEQILGQLVGQDGSLNWAISAVEEAYTDLLAQILGLKDWEGGDYKNELEWFRFDCEYGDTPQCLYDDVNAIKVTDATSLLAAIETAL